MTGRSLWITALLATACSGSPGNVSTATVQIARADLDWAARAGFPARLVLQPEGRHGDVAPGNETLLVWTGQSARVIPSEALAKRTTPESRTAFLAQWVEPFLRENDLDGAIRGLTRGYLEFLRTETGWRPVGPLPPLLPPNPDTWGRRAQARPWVWLVVAGCVAVLAWADGRVQRAEEERRRRSAMAAAAAARSAGDSDAERRA